MDTVAWWLDPSSSPSATAVLLCALRWLPALGLFVAIALGNGSLWLALALAPCVLFWSVPLLAEGLPAQALGGGAWQCAAFEAGLGLAMTLRVLVPFWALSWGLSVAGGWACSAGLAPRWRYSGGDDAPALRLVTLTVAALLASLGALDRAVEVWQASYRSIPLDLCLGGAPVLLRSAALAAARALTGGLGLALLFVAPVLFVALCLEPLALLAHMIGRRWKYRAADELPWRPLVLLLVGLLLGPYLVAQLLWHARAAFDALPPR